MVDPTNDGGDKPPTRDRSLSDSLKELREALKDSSEVGQSEEDNTVSSQYAKAAADSNVELARRSLLQDPNNPMLKDWLAFNLYASGHYEEAARTYEQCVAMNDRNPDQHYYLGNCYQRVGDERKAIGEWRRVLQLDPNCKCAKKALDKLTKVAGPGR